MKKPLVIEDLIEGEGDQLSQDLFDGLGELRADHDEFLREVKQRIGEEAETSEPVESEESKPQAILKLPVFVQRAAAFFPPVLLPQGMIKIGFPVGSKVSAKILPGVMLFPALSAAMVLLTFALGLRAVLGGKKLGQRQNEVAARDDSKAWWRRYWLPSLVMMIGVVWMLFHAPNDALTLLVSFSTLVFLGVYASLARAGLASRQEVAKRATAAMYWLTGTSLQLSVPDTFAGRDLTGAWLVPLVLLFGGTVCRQLGNLGRRGKGSVAGRSWIGMDAFFAALVLALHFGPIGKIPTSLEDVNQWLSSLDDTSQINQVQLVVSNMETASELSFDSQTLKAAAKQRLDNEILGGSFNHLYAAALMELGCFEEEHYRAVANPEKIGRYTRSEAPTSSRAEHLLPAIMAELHLGSISTEQREAIAGRVIAAVAPGYKYANSKDLFYAVRVLDVLGFSDRATELKSASDEILRATWVLEDDEQEGAFATYSASLEYDETGLARADRLTFVWGHATAQSIWIMNRLGVPRWMSARDLGVLDAYLARTSRHYGISGLNEYDAEPAAAQALLHTLPEWKAARAELVSTILGTFYDLRALLAAVLLAAFSTILTWMAPQKGEEAVSPG
jgi:hypothetical protein